MHLDNFDLNLLVALDALLTERHVTRAAEKLCVSQPAMSGALARLRVYLGDPLLEKVGSGLELTPRAAEMAGEVRDLLLKIRTTLRAEPTFVPWSSEREFRLIMSDYTTSVFMPVLNRRLLTQAPRIRCHVENLGPDSLTKVDRGLADFCITVQERELLDDSEIAAQLNGEPLFEDEFVLVVDAKGPAAHLPLSQEEFFSLPYAEVRFTHVVFSVVEAAIRHQKLPLKAALIMPSFTAAACVLPGTPMTTLIPRRLAELLGPPLGLVIRPAPIAVPPVKEVLLWHKRSDADPAHAWFRELLHTAAADLPTNR
ncbi:MAG: hypothetical protein QOI59_55 [Gammaproteobacteria bacterium]|nr:hypothetical protein [Gammaproteobacteria bacterium]